MRLEVAGVRASWKTRKDSLIVADVPDGAMGDGVMVTLGTGDQAIWPHFTVQPCSQPIIDSIRPDRAKRRATVSIFGSGLGPPGGQRYVYVEIILKCHDIELLELAYDDSKLSYRVIGPVVQQLVDEF